MKIPFAGGEYTTFSKNLNAQECINFYSALDNEGGVSKFSLRGFPGLKEWCDTGEYAEVRGAKEMGAYLYAVVGNKAFRVSSSGTSTQCTGTLETSSGKVSMAENGTELCVVDGNYGYTVTGTTVSKITGSSFPNSPKTVTERGGYFIVSIDGSGRGYVSDLLDGTSWSTGYFNAEGNPDNTVAIFEDHLKLIMFGERSIDPYYLSSSTVPFDQYPGLFQNVGLGARHSPAKNNNLVGFLTHDYQVSEYGGGEPQIVSPDSINYQIAQLSRKDDAIGMGVTIQGQPFYIITFPEANMTFAYNSRTKLWNRLCSYPEPYQNRWRGNCAEYFDGKWIIGDYQNGKLYELDYETYTDDGETIRRTRTLPAIHKDGRLIFHDKLSLFFEMGVGLDGGVQGEDPQVMLEYSDDGGHTWEGEFWTSMGKIGEYSKFSYGCQWTRLGSSKFRNYRFSISDPVKCVLVDADLEADIGTS